MIIICVICHLWSLCGTTSQQAEAPPTPATDLELRGGPLLKPKGTVWHGYNPKGLPKHPNL